MKTLILTLTVLAKLTLTFLKCVLVAVKTIDQCFESNANVETEANENFINQERVKAITQNAPLLARNKEQAAQTANYLFYDS